MRRVLLALALLATGPGLAAAEDPSVLPDAPNRDEIFYLCTACHGTAVITRSRLTRQQWDDLMTWMTEVHGMAPLEGRERQEVVDYLARHFGPAQGPAARARNPFLN
ncbi:MAG: hypothetical protein RMK64_02955 [Rhodovarius sp.]|nr:hypothetical protein [Rhodovarius sp.]MDW8313908.1 hypothetical protein [Rhodovarius sp.]